MLQLFVALFVHVRKLFVTLFMLGLFITLFGNCSSVWPPDQCDNKPEMEASWKRGGDWMFPLHPPQLLELS